MREQATAEFVVKPAVGAGSRDAARYAPGEASGGAEAASGCSMPGAACYCSLISISVDLHGETALIYFAGRFSHAIRKGPLLPRGSAPSDGLIALEHITPRVRRLRRVAGGGPRAGGAAVRGAAVCARGPDHGPRTRGACLLELELTEPSLFFAHAPGAAQRFARLCRRAAAD